VRCLRRFRAYSEQTNGMSESLFCLLDVSQAVS
jgi:hypothetical protein